jgi:UDP-MurNAc hydroxylase
LRIEFVNHSSFLQASGGVRLICDPWLGGAAFDDSWGLLAPTALRYEDFAGVTHLWFSHEHPDHFHPPTLKRIPPELRARITVLYQESLDRKVIEHCRGLGFKEARELPTGQWVELAKGFDVKCAPQAGFQDSWLATRTPGGVVLNVNDCPLFERELVRAIRTQVGPIDVLATQFSISAWDGNREDLARRRRGAQTMLDRAVMHAEEFGARYVLPIASFIWFCHEENAWMNDGFLPLAQVVEELRTRTKSTPVLMYPGDTWELGEAWDNAPALARYEADVASLATRPRSAPKLVDADELMKNSREFCAQMRSGSDPLRLKLRWAAKSARRNGHGGVRKLVTVGQRLLAPETATVFVTDHARAYSFHPVKGLRPIELGESVCDMSLSSAALNYAFRFLWGGETLLFNGRFRENREGSRQRLFDYFHMAGHRNFGGTATWSSLPADIARRARGALTRRGGAGQA